MSTILVTGASGFIPKALANHLAESGKHEVVAIGRHGIPERPHLKYVRGEFHNFEDLRALDKFSFDAVIHLGAVTGGCSERDGLMVNVEGTRRLMRYLIDRGCRKFVMASSIALVGIEDTAFQPLQLPIPDEHPCLDRWGYGVSKYLMEEVTKYYHRQNPDIDVINLRLATVRPDENREMLTEITPGQPLSWTLGRFTILYLSDAVRLLRTAAESPHKSGVRIMNAVAPKIASTLTVPQIFRGWWPDTRLDLSRYERPGHERDALYAIDRVQKELGFTTRLIPGE